MNCNDYRKIADEAKNAVTELIEKAELKEGQLLVIGCSTSEVTGGDIGHNSSMEAAIAIFGAVYSVLENKGIYLAAQCCEHLNRALILEREIAEKRGYEFVNVMPQPKAGGSFATTCYKNFREPVAVEHIKADAGLDIGLTLIGMHLRHVAVPLRLETKKIGEATITAARTRAKFIGGERAHYSEKLL